MRKNRQQNRKEENLIKIALQIWFSFFSMNYSNLFTQQMYSECLLCASTEIDSEDIKETQRQKYLPSRN